MFLVAMVEMVPCYCPHQHPFPAQMVFRAGILLPWCRCRIMHAILVPCARIDTQPYFLR